MKHIERMEVELKELAEKIHNGLVFLSKENKEPKFTNPKQRELLDVQLGWMSAYRETLKTRIEYEKKLCRISKLREGIWE